MTKTEELQDRWSAVMMNNYGVPPLALASGDGAVVTAQSGIPNDIAPGRMVSGSPAIDTRQWMRSVAIFSRLPELIRSLRRTP